MLSLLFPAALAGLALLAIPVIIHLLRPRKVRRTPFSSLRWLHLTEQRLSRRLRWHQILLFLLRAAFVSLLVFAVAKPILDRRTASGSAERFVVLDVSRSMGYRTGEKPSPLDVGKLAAARLLASGGADDRTALLTVAQSTKLVGPPTRAAEQYAARLSPIVAESSDTNLGSSLDVVRTLLARRREGARVELFLITDGHPGSLRRANVESFVAEFPEGVETTIVDVAERGAQNGWVADARFHAAEGDDPPVVDVQLRAVGGAIERTVRLMGTGLNERSQPVTLGSERPTPVRFELPADFDPRGKTCEIVLDPPDGLPSDDRWYVALDGGSSLDVLVVEGRTAAGAAASPGFALRTAIEALASAERPIRVVAKPFNEVEPADFDIDVVLLADVPSLSDVALDALDERVRRGLGLGVFLGPGVDADFYRRRLIDPVERSKSLMPLSVDRTADVPMSAGGLAPLENIAWNHPLLAGLFDPSLGDLADVRVRSYFRFAAPPTAGATVLAAVDGTPWLVEHTVGAGKVILFNATADDAWSDLPRRKSFVPLVDRLLNDLSGGLMQRTFTTGEAVALALPPLAEGETVSVVGPGGDVLTPRVSAAGHAARLQLPPQAEPGVYRVRRGGEAPETTFVVQTARGDSAIAPLDDGVPSWWQPAACRIVRGTDVEWSTAAERTSLAPWAVLLAALVLALETLYVHRLCPRMTPKLTPSIVAPRRPIVSPQVSSNYESLA